MRNAPTKTRLAREMIGEMNGIMIARQSRKAHDIARCHRMHAAFMHADRQIFKEMDFDRCCEHEGRIR